MSADSLAIGVGLLAWHIAAATVVFIAWCSGWNRGFMAGMKVGRDLAVGLHEEPVD